MTSLMTSNAISGCSDVSKQKRNDINARRERNDAERQSRKHLNYVSFFVSNKKFRPTYHEPAWRLKAAKSGHADGLKTKDR